MKKIFACLFGCLSYATAHPAELYADLPAGRITFVRMHTTNHGTINARKVAVVVISGLGGGCSTGVFMDAGANQETLSVILAAHVAKTPIGVIYEPTQKVPWGDNSVCALTAFDIK
jgi:hypothetical protein